VVGVGYVVSDSVHVFFNGFPGAHGSARRSSMGTGPGRPSPRQPEEPGADLRPGMPLGPEPSAPIHRQAAAVHPQNTPLDLFSAADGDVIAWPDVTHGWKATARGILAEAARCEPVTSLVASQGPPYHIRQPRPTWCTSAMPSRWSRRA
jgi:hypothetical protein